MDWFPFGFTIAIGTADWELISFVLCEYGKRLYKYNYQNTETHTGR